MKKIALFIVGALPALGLFMFGRPGWAGLWLVLLLFIFLLLLGRRGGIAMVAFLFGSFAFLLFAGLSLGPGGAVRVNLAGLTTGFILYLFIVLSLMFFASEFILVTQGGDRRHSFQYLISWLIGLNGFVKEVKDGEVKDVKPKGLLAPASVSNMVIIHSQQVVVFECAGKFTRMEGPGIVYTEPLEFIRKVFITRPRFQKFTLQDAFTKDGIPLTIEGNLMFQLAKDPFKDEVPGQTYPVSKDAVLRATYSSHDWEVDTREVAINLLRDKIAQSYLDDIYDPQNKGTFPIGQMKREIREKLGEIADNWGTVITSFQITDIKPPESVKKRMLDTWEATWKREEQIAQEKQQAELALIEAETEAKKLELTERARAKAKAEIVDKVLGIIEQHTGQKDPEMALAYLQALMMGEVMAAGYPPSLRPYLWSERALEERTLLEIARAMPKIDARAAKAREEKSEDKPEQEGEARYNSAQKKAQTSHE